MPRSLAKSCRGVWKPHVRASDSLCLGTSLSPRVKLGLPRSPDRHGCRYGWVVTAAGTWLNVTIAHQRLDVYMNEYGWYPFTMMGALGGIALVLGLLQLLEYHERTAAAKPVSSLLRYIGKNSFIFYSLNQVGLLIGEEILGACGIPLNNITWPWQLLWGGACIVIAVLLCVPMVEFTNRCFPQILGKPRRISAAS